MVWNHSIIRPMVSNHWKPLKPMIKRLEKRNSMTNYWQCWDTLVGNINYLRLFDKKKGRMLLIFQQPCFSDQHNLFESFGSDWWIEEEGGLNLIWNQLIDDSRPKFKTNKNKTLVSLRWMLNVSTLPGVLLVLALVAMPESAPLCFSWKFPSNFCTN